MIRKIKNKSIVTLCFVLILLAIAGFFTWKHYHDIAIRKQQASGNGTSINNVNYGPPTAAQKQAGDQTKESNTKSASDMANSTSGPGTETQQSGMVTISRVSQPNGSSTVSLRALVDGATSGTCVVTFSKTGEASVQQSVPVTNSATYYSCSPVDIATSRFSISGIWNVSVYVANAQGTSISNTATSSVMVQK